MPGSKAFRGWRSQRDFERPLKADDGSILSFREEGPPADEEFSVEKLNTSEDNNATD